MDVEHLISVVTQITKDLEEGCDLESLDCKYAEFKEAYPKIHSLAKGDPSCLQKLKEVQKLKAKKTAGTSQYDVSVEFGKILADQYLTKK